MLSTGSFMRFEIFYFNRCPVPSTYFIFAPLGVPASFLFYFCAAGSSGLIPILFLRRWEFRASFLFYFCAAGSSVSHSYFIFALLGAPCLIPILFCAAGSPALSTYFILDFRPEATDILFDLCLGARFGVHLCRMVIVHSVAPGRRRPRRKVHGPSVLPV